MGNIADTILQNQDREGMLRRSLERIIQLYTDKSHFVYELLQNAEDAEASSIKFIQYEDCLQVMHDGNPFTTENLQGLCDIGKSDKVNNLNQIGEFGVGFKSVFGICDTVRLYSAPEGRDISDSCQPFAIEIQDFTKPVDIPSVPVPKGYTTLFVFPYRVGFQFSGFKTIAALNKVISERLKNLGVTTLLFMRHLKLIEYEIKIPGQNASGEYLLDQEVINDHCVRVSAVESENKKEDSSISFIKFTMPIDSATSMRTIDIAFAISTDKNGKTSFVKTKNPYISVYFPTETRSELDFIVQGPFRTTPNRESVPEKEEENIALAKKVSKLLRSSVLELRDMKMVDLSLIQILPLDECKFKTYGLFSPLYEETLSMLKTESILPVKDSTNYIKASNALIARGKEIAELFPSDLITDLIDDKKKHDWLPISLTETGPFRDVLGYFTNQLEIEVIRPEDLRDYFNKNTQFFSQRDNEWFVKLYKLYETVPNIFSEGRYRNMLDAKIIKTASGDILAPFKRVEMAYNPNVFLPSKCGNISGIAYVHPYLFEQCRSFFEKVLHLTIPNEYQFFVRDIEKKYSQSVYSGHFEEHVQDIQKLISYLKSQEHGSEIRSIARMSFLLRCRKGNQVVWVHPFESRILFPQTENGLMLEQYYKGISNDVCFIDYDAYQSAGVFYDNLKQLGVTESILTGETTTWGEYYTGNLGRRPEWRTSGDFRWELSIDRVEDVLKYISQNPKAKDSIIKSQTIFKILQTKEAILVGNVFIGGSIPHKFDEPAEIVRILNQECYSWKYSGWNGKWLYTESMELVSHKAISKHDLNKAIYGKVSLDSKLYDILGFKKGKIDLHEAIVKDYDALPEERKQSYFEIELERRFHITPEQLKIEISGFVPPQEDRSDDGDVFPTGVVKNWDALRKHAAQILSYASPTVYATVVRSIRVSRPQDDIRAYLMNMYRVNSTYKYACQLCHKPVSNIVASELELKPDVELDPMNLCLCPNCAQKFREFRNNSYQSSRLIEEILHVSESEMDSDCHVSVAVGDYDFWFTQIHIAEITELLKLKKQAKNEKRSPAPVVLGTTQEKNSYTLHPETTQKISASKATSSTSKDEDDEFCSDMSAYKEIIGKRIYHKGKKAYAKVIDLTSNAGKLWISLNFESGDNAGTNKPYDLLMCLNNQWIEVVD